MTMNEAGVGAQSGCSWGVALGKVLSANEVLEAGLVAERLGFDEVWVSNERFHRDMFASLGALAVRTNTVRLGSFVSDPYTMHPLVSAAAVATVDQLSGGRMMFGIGAGGSGFGAIGIGRTKPFTGLASMVEATRALLDGESVTVDGEFTINDGRLDQLPVSRVPIVLASQSPRVLDLGGRAADAVMISTFADSALFAKAMRWAAEGAGAAGRQFDVAERVIARIDLAIDDDRDAARDRLRPLIGYLLVLLHPNWWFLDDLGIEVPSQLGELAVANDYAGMRHHLALIPDGLIDAFGWAGTPDLVARRVVELVDVGVRRFVVLPHAVAGGFVDTMSAFASEVIPAVAAKMSQGDRPA